MPQKKPANGLIEVRNFPLSCFLHCSFLTCVPSCKEMFCYITDYFKGSKFKKNWRSGFIIAINKYEKLYMKLNII